MLPEAERRRHEQVLSEIFYTKIRKSRATTLYKSHKLEMVFVHVWSQAVYDKTIQECDKYV